jgi:hypothetical protein
MHAVARISPVANTTIAVTSKPRHQDLERPFIDTGKRKKNKRTHMVHIGLFFGCSEGKTTAAYVAAALATSVDEAEALVQQCFGHWKSMPTAVEWR